MSSSSSTAYLYRIPLQNVDGVSTPLYKPSISGGLYLYHYEGDYLYIIQGGGASHFHRDDVNVVVKELDKDEVEENSDDLIGKYIRR